MNQIIRVLEHITIKDFMDIFTVSIVIYNILRIIRGTRAVQMLFGLLAIFILFWVSAVYELYSLNWILDNFFQSFFVIFIILFQEQIRSALVSFGNARWWGRKDLNLQDSVVEEIVSAVGALSREKTGAIIVFQRRNGLLNYAQTGTLIEGKVHSDLLYSIFQHISPLHDGAVLIVDNMIQAAGVFLPLSKNVEIDRHLGNSSSCCLGGQ